MVGEPTERAREFERVSRDTIAAICAHLRPGVAAAEVAEIGQQKLAPVREQITFHGFFGYPTGIGFPPTWDERSGFNLVADNPRPLVAGMTFHVPINLRIHAEWGIGMSQTVVVTEAGGEALSRLPLELTVIA